MFVRVLSVCLVGMLGLQSLQAEDIFFTATADTGVIDQILQGNMPTDTGSDLITIGPQASATLLLWSDGELAIDSSTGPAFGYSISASGYDSSILDISVVTSLNPEGNDGEQRWFDTFDFGVNWTAIGAGTFDDGQGVGPTRKTMDPFFDVDQNAFLLGYATFSAVGPGTSLITPEITPILSLTGNETVSGVTVTVASIPEPGSATIVCGLLVGALCRRRRS